MNERDLKSYYTRLFELSYYHHYDLATLEDMPVFELDIYIDMIKNAIKEAQKGDSADPFGDAALMTQQRTIRGQKIKTPKPEEDGRRNSR